MMEVAFAAGASGSTLEARGRDRAGAATGGGTDRLAALARGSLGSLGASCSSASVGGAV